MDQTSEVTTIHSFVIIFLSYNLVTIQNKTVVEKRNAISIPFILSWPEFEGTTEHIFFNFC